MGGLFITFEGPDGSGKSTQIELLGRALTGRDPLLVREPGGTEVGERIRDLLLHTQIDMTAEAEMYLYMAARAELTRTRILPALDAGRIVIADRYHDSTLAYQGGARGAETHWPGHFPKPDRTFLLALSPEAGIERRRDATGLDRLESEPPAFHRAVMAAYDRLAAAEPERWVRLDASIAPERLHERVMAEVEQLLEVVPQ